MFLPIITILASLTLTSALPANTLIPTIQKRDMTGRGTYYNQHGVAGSCGQVFQDSDMIVALGPSHRSGKSNCGRQIWAIATSGPGINKRIIATVRDTCASCGFGDVDFSVAAFNQLTNNNLGVGVIGVKWNWV